MRARIQELAGVLLAFAACNEMTFEAEVKLAGPALPAPPVLTPCPEGWRVVDATRPGDPPRCMLSAPICEGTQTSLPGETSCGDVGVACPPGDWPAGLPADRIVLYVNPASELGGTGTIDAPLTTIAEATAAASPGTIVALAKGVYDEQVTLPGGVELWGACSAETAITSEGIAGAGIVEVVGPGAVLRNLRVGPGVRAGIVIDGPGRSATIEGVIVERATLAGIVASREASATARRLVVRSTQGDPGYGVLVTSGGSVSLTTSSIMHSRGLGIFVRGQAGDPRAPRIVLTQVAVDQVEASAHVAFLHTGISAVHGGTITADAIAVRGAGHHGIRLGDGARGTFRDAYITQVYVGIDVEAATLHAERLFTYTFAEAIVARRSTMTISDVIATAVSGFRGTAINCGDGGTLDARRVLTDFAALAAWTGCTVTASDVIGRGGIEVTGTGVGHVVAHDTMLTVERVLLEHASIDGVRAQTNGTIVARDVTIRDLHGTQLGPVALLAGLGARLEVERARVERIAGIGIGATLSSSVHATDVHVTEILDRDCGDETRCDGYGVASALASDLELHRFRIERAAVAGAQVGPRSRLDLDTGVIAASPMGINLQAPELDRDRFRAVTFIDNGVDLDTSPLPVPSR